MRPISYSLAATQTETNVDTNAELKSAKVWTWPISSCDFGQSRTEMDRVRLGRASRALALVAVVSLARERDVLHSVNMWVLFSDILKTLNEIFTIIESTVDI